MGPHGGDRSELPAKQPPPASATLTLVFFSASPFAIQTKPRPYYTKPCAAVPSPSSRHGSRRGRLPHLRGRSSRASVPPPVPVSFAAAAAAVAGRRGGGAAGPPRGRVRRLLLLFARRRLGAGAASLHLVSSCSGYLCSVGRCYSV